MQVFRIKYIFSLSILFLLAPALLSGCSNAGREKGSAAVLVFKHGKIAGDPAPFNQLLRGFEAANPGITIKDEILPSSTDEQHQFYVINLEGGSSDFDVMSMDVIWVPEFAKAGWLRDISHLLGSQKRKDFFPGPMQAVTYRDRLYAVPWYIDAGVLYYRKDLLRKYGFLPPDSWQDLVRIARYITEREHGMYGFVWQGKQYEGLVCNTLEYFWGNGGDVLRDSKVVIDSPENVYALGFIRDLVWNYKVSPPLVTTATEETTRHIFGNGKAVFMRNWPYAWNLFEKEGSAVKGKVGVTLLPYFKKGLSASTLGGWQLGINAYSKHPREAEKLITYLTSPESQKTLALTVGYKPTRKSLYKNGELLREQPFVAGLFEVFMKARPRPVSPYYMMITQVMQPEFSAAITRIKTPKQALRSSQKQIAHIIGTGE
jgi:multiple sugar transport system substrate-binding protein